MDIPPFPEYSWSVTRYGSYDRCPRQYFFQYYGGWQGWPGGSRHEDHLARNAYFWSKRETIPTWSGKLIHDAIAFILNGGNPDQMRDRVIEACRKDWKMSLVRGEMLRSKGIEACRKPKLILLMEHVDRDPPPGILEEVEEKVIESLDTFNELGILGEFREARESGRYSYAENPGDAFKPKHLEIPDPGSGEVINVWSMLDCAFEYEEGKCIIYDWKTGQLPLGADSSRLTDQLMVYACYAIGPKGMQREPGEAAIEAYEMYLPEGRALGGEVTPGDMEDVKQRSLIQGRELRDLHDRIEEMGQLACPASPGEKKCLHCQFNKICDEAWTAAE